VDFQKQSNNKKNNIFYGIYIISILIIYIIFAIISYNSNLSPFIKSLILVSISGGIGGIIYIMIKYFKPSLANTIEINESFWFYLFGPIISSVFGLFIFFFIYGGLLNINYLPPVISLKNILIFCAISFFSGFFIAYINTESGRKILSKVLQVHNLCGIYLFVILIIYILTAFLCNYFLNLTILIKFLILSSISGGLGGILYCIIDYYRSMGEKKEEIKNWLWWYFFRPFASSVLGAFVFFFLYGGLFVVNNHTTETISTKSILFYCSLSFVFGYTFTNFFEMVTQIADVIFSKSSGKK
jgi:hypothetical protein